MSALCFKNDGSITWSRYLKKLLFVVLFLLNTTLIHADGQSPVWFTHPMQEDVKITVDLFLSSTCSHCHKADVFFQKLEKKEPWLVVHRYLINQDKTALHLFYERLQQQDSDNFSVPAVFFCNTRWAGFDNEANTGKALMHALNFCRQSILKKGELSPSTVNVIRQWGNASQVQIDFNYTKSPAMLLFVSALTDAFTSCSLFCFAAFLAFLWLYPTQKWVQFYTGIAFLLPLCVVHYLQQVYSVMYYQNIGKLRLIAAVVGLLLVFSMFRYWRKKGVSNTCMPTVFGFSLVILTVIVVQIYQQTCLFNVSLVIEQWLAEQAISHEKRVFYQMLYQLFYAVPFTLLLLFYWLFGRSKRITPYPKMFSTAACLMLMSIGVILVFYPALLASPWASIFVLIAALVIGWMYRK